jgi:predicted TPR repeat methyltransferase
MSSKLKRRRNWRPTSTSASFHDRLAGAVQLHQKGQPRAAAEIYRSLLEEGGEQADVLQFLGVAEHQLGNSAQGLTYIDRALELAPDHLEARNNRGNILKSLGRLEAAEADYRQVLKARPSDPNTLSNLGTILRSRGDLAGAEAMFKEVLALKPDHAPAWQNLGNVLDQAERSEEAIDAHRRAMLLAPQSEDSYRYLGRTLYAVGRIEEATGIFRRWLELFPQDPRAQHYVAACTGESAPRRASDDYVRAEFNGFAATFDESLAQLEYRAPALIEEEVARLLGAPAPGLAVLDAGCGTGLCGPRVRPRASFLAGVDLSTAMIDLARKRAVYDTLVVAELTAYLQAHPGASDLIVSADTLVYFGDLAEVAMAASQALRATGTLAFTVERATPEAAPNGFRLHPHGRYSHTSDYLLHTLATTGFVDRSLREVALRKEAGKWVDGWLVSARKGDDKPL